MISLRLFIEHGAYPLWIYDEEDGGVIDTALPEEWRDDIELSRILDSIQDQYDALFINNEKNFYFIGFKDRSSATAFISLVETAIQYIVEKNAGKYLIRNDINDAFYDGLYTAEQ